MAIDDKKEQIKQYYKQKEIEENVQIQQQKRQNIQRK